MRQALRGLTTRGRSFLAAAAAAALSALLLGEKDLLRVALLLLLLPLLGAVTVARTRYRLTCQRELRPGQIPVGATAQVVLRLRNLSRFPTGTVLLEDRLPYALGSRPRLVVERLRPQQPSSVVYTVRADVRGRYEIGPLMLRVTDPFGLCEMVRAFPVVDRLTVIPKVSPLPPIRLTGEYTGSGDSRARSVAVHGEDDTATREYRHGDDLRRVHWRSTARVGELMVRREEQPWESRATLLLDTREAAHRGEGPASSFEWAVAAAASIAMHLRQAGYKLRVVTDETELEITDAAGEGVLLERLAEIRLQSRSDLTGLVDHARHAGAGGLIVGIVGLLTPAESEQLTRLNIAGATCVAFAVDSTTWLQLPDEQRTALLQPHQSATTALLRSGWRVIDVSYGARLVSLWPLVAANGGSGSAYRTAMAETVAHGRP